MIHIRLASYWNQLIARGRHGNRAPVTERFPTIWD